MRPRAEPLGGFGSQLFRVMSELGLSFRQVDEGFTVEQFLTTIAHVAYADDVARLNSPGRRS